MIERFFNKIYKTETCWLWTGCKDSNGYGRFSFKRRNRLAHRICYYIFFGDIPKKLVVDHLCNNPGCVNPEHLEAVTDAVNLSRRPMAKKNCCVHGHVYTEKSTYYRKDRPGYRQCKTCGLIKNKEYKRIQRRKLGMKIIKPHGL